ncbi:stage III sporulation protein SpoIIIAB [Paenibacillus sp. MMS18-CY102]|uniref:stage III sporulation protein SpoIIIAB n=1 Tax=Paenibacillus sp. MMS18-CY102 TaxID=2682849 RepID=UPI001366515E|nr:stage III sporulation protein SpoIIIAB [Paenibacillus sp. MMS18-CY102]MWC28357.1 stage III sporulation protein AB [Paenibacillus sp. MMS18-CY102]
MLVKLIGAALILFAGTLIGFLQAARFADRPKQIRQLASALQRLETEIVYGRTPLPEALMRISANVEQPSARLMEAVIAQLQQGDGKTFNECWESAIRSQWPSTAMRAAEMAVVIRLGSMLGISDKDDQLKHLRLAAVQLKAEEDAARDEQAKYEKMSRSLGVLLAILVVILMV